MANSQTSLRDEPHDRRDHAVFIITTLFNSLNLLSGFLVIHFTKHCLLSISFSWLILTDVSMFAFRMSLAAVRMCNESQEKRLQGNHDK